MDKIDLFIDESGTLGKNNRYFLICAIEVSNVKVMARKARKTIYNLKLKYNIDKSIEVKGWKLSDEQRRDILTSIINTNVKIRYIVIDLYHTTMYLQNSEDKNACYNYLVQLIVKKLIKDYPMLNNITLNLDNRTIKVGHRMSLKLYLYNKFVLEKTNYKQAKRIEFTINYLNSKNNFLIEWADILANSIFKKYNQNNKEFYKLIKKNMVFESKFPSKTFGKDV